jgi:hypothetical protein
VTPIPKALFALIVAAALAGCAPPAADTPPAPATVPVAAETRPAAMAMAPAPSATAPAPSATPATAQPLVPTENAEPALTPVALASLTPGSPAEQRVAQARAHLAQKLGLDPAQISVFSVAEVVWPDSSLGCPQPDVAYLPVLTPGFQILLEAEGTVYTFHTDEAGQAVLCSARPPDEIFIPP